MPSYAESNSAGALQSCLLPPSYHIKHGSSNLQKCSDRIFGQKPIGSFIRLSLFTIFLWESFAAIRMYRRHIPTVNQYLQNHSHNIFYLLQSLNVYLKYHFALILSFAHQWNKEVLFLLMLLMRSHILHYSRFQICKTIDTFISLHLRTAASSHDTPSSFCESFALICLQVIHFFFIISKCLT